MGQLGADVEALDRLSQRFHTQSASLTRAAADISSLVSSSWWEGADRAAFSAQ